MCFFFFCSYHSVRLRRCETTTFVVLPELISFSHYYSETFWVRLRRKSVCNNYLISAETSSLGGGWREVKVQLLTFIFYWIILEKINGWKVIVKEKEESRESWYDNEIFCCHFYLLMNLWGIYETEEKEVKMRRRWVGVRKWDYWEAEMRWWNMMTGTGDDESENSSGRILVFRVLKIQREWDS